MRTLLCLLLLLAVACQPNNKTESTAETPSDSLTASDGEIVNADPVSTVPTSYAKWEETNYIHDIADPRTAYGIIAAGKTLYSDTSYKSAAITNSPDVAYLIKKEKGAHVVDEENCLMGSWQKIYLGFSKDTVWVDLVEVLVNPTTSPVKAVNVDGDAFLFFLGTQSAEVPSKENGCPDHMTPYFYNKERSMLSLIEVPEGFEFPETNIFAESYNGWLAFRSSVYGEVKIQNLSPRASGLDISIKAIYSEGGETLASVSVVYEQGSFVLDVITVFE